MHRNDYCSCSPHDQACLSMVVLIAFLSALTLLRVMQPVLLNAAVHMKHCPSRPSEPPAGLPLEFQGRFQAMSGITSLTAHALHIFVSSSGRCSRMLMAPCFMWHRKQKAVCHCLAAILNLADDSSMDTPYKPVLAEWTSWIFSLSLSRNRERQSGRQIQIMLCNE